MKRLAFLFACFFPALALAQGSIGQQPDSRGTQTSVAGSYTNALTASPHSGWVKQRGAVKDLTGCTPLAPINSLVASLFRVTLTGNCVFPNPSNLGPNDITTFEIFQDANGGRCPSFGSNYRFSPTTQANIQACFGGSGSAFSTAAFSESSFTCISPYGTYWSCFDPEPNIGPLSPVLSSAILQYTGCTGGTGGAAGAIICTTDPIALTAGTSLLIAASQCGSTCTNTTSPTGNITSITTSPSLTGTCVLVTGTRGIAQNQGIEMQLCPITGSGSAAITLNYSATAYYIAPSYAVINGALVDAGIGNFGSGSGTTASVNSNGSSNPANNLAIAYVATQITASTAISPAAGWTTAASFSQYLLEYKWLPATGIVNAAAGISPTAPYNIAIGIFK